MVFKTALMIKPTKKITKQKTLDLSFRIYSDAIINNKEIDVLVFLMLCLETLGQECIYIYIYIFSDLLNQKFLLQIDCKSAKYIIEKDVENIASKHIFARWQAILSVFYFNIEYIKGSQNAIPNFLTREFLQCHNGK